MAGGVRIKDGMTKPCIVKKISTHTFRIILTQGLNRQIRRMCEHFDYKVMSLQRTRIMNVKLDGLALGKWRYLSEVEISTIMEMISDSSKTG